MTGYLSTEKVQKAALLSNFTPSIMAPQVLEDILVQRHELVTDLVDRIVISITTENKHFPLLIGARGMGKTHLVSIVYNRIKDREDLQERVIIGWLREEEWGISSWLDLVVRIFRSIGEEYPDTELGSISINNIAILQSHSPMEAEVYADSLLAEFVGKKTLFLIIENLDDIFDGMGAEGQQRLRAFLQEYKCCTILATTPVLFQGILSGKESFYGWFTRFDLQPFTHENAIELLTNIAAQSGDKELASFLHTPAGSARVRAVHRLAGGNPRVYTLFAQLITKQDLDSLVGAFMKMLDDLMPYYQSRMTMLSPQQRKIVAYLVDNTEAVIVKDIATWCFATPQTISSQLKDLKAKGYVVSSSVGKESYYELTEVLMRLCLEVKKYRGKEVKSLVEMIRIWYRPEEIKAQFDRLILLGNVEHARYYALALEYSHTDPVLRACQQDFQKSLERGDSKSALKIWEELADRYNITIEKSQSVANLIIKDKFSGSNSEIESTLKNYFLNVDPLIYEDNYFQGLLLYQADKPEAIVDILGRVFNIRIDLGNAYVRRGIVLGVLGETEAAIVSFDRAIEVDPCLDTAWHNRGLSLGKIGRYEEAIDSYDRALELNNHNDSAWYCRGNILGRVNKYEEAVASYDRALEINVNNDDAWYFRGNVLSQMNRCEDAVDSYNRALDINHFNDNFWYFRGNSLGILNKHEEAIASYDRALEININNDDAWYFRGNVLSLIGKYEEAIDSCDRALEVNPNSDRALYFRGNILSLIEKYEEAIASYDRALAINANNDDAWFFRGNALIRTEKYEEAVASYNLAIKINPDYHEIWHNRGFAFYKWGKYQNALDAYQQAININPDRYDSWHDRGLVFFQIGNYAEALDAWRAAFKIIRDLQPSDTSNLIQEVLDEQLLAKFQQPTVRDLMPQLLEIYTEAEVLPELGVALTRNLKAVMSPIISDYTANEWLKMWQELGKPHLELGLAVKMVAAGVKYKQNPQDKRIFLALPQELRPLLREALGLGGDG